MNAKKVGLLAMIAAGVVSQAAFAETRFDDEAQQAKPVAQEVSAPVAVAKTERVEFEAGRITEVGSSKKAAIFVKEGFGKNVPVLLALKQTTPMGWRAKKDGSVDLSKVVSWTGKRAWLEVLSDIARDGNVDVKVIWDEKLLVVSQAKRTVLEVKTTETQQKALPKHWSLEPGKSLRENIEAWAAKTSSPKWSVAWLAANYQIKFPATFTGEFDDEQNGPIAAVMEAFRNHDIPLRAEFQDDNHVLKIENAIYSQQKDRLNKLEEPWNGRGNN